MAEWSSGGRSKLGYGEVAEAKSMSRGARGEKELTVYEVRTCRCGQSSGGAGRRERVGGRPQANQCGGAGAMPPPCEGDEDSSVFTQLPIGSTRLYPVILWVGLGH
jgi:hypothetical protein